MLRRIVGLLILIAGILGLVLAVAGAYGSYKFIDGVGQALDSALTRTAETLGTVRSTLLTTKATLEGATSGIGTVGQAADNAARSLVDSQPLIQQATDVTTQRIPDSLEAVEKALPNIAAVAATIDKTLMILDAFKFEQKLPFVNTPIKFDLGIDYKPEAPFDETILEMGKSLEGLPESLRGMEVSLNSVNENMATIGQNIQGIATNLNSIQTSLGTVPPLLDDYIKLVDDTITMTGTTKTSIAQNLKMGKWGATVLFVWFALYNLVPLAYGIQLLFGRRARAAAVPAPEPVKAS